MHDDSFDHFESSLVSLAQLLFAEISNQAVFDDAVLLTRFFFKCMYIISMMYTTCLKHLICVASP